MNPPSSTAPPDKREGDKAKAEVQYFPTAPKGAIRELNGAVYKGPDPDLKGKTAIVRVYADYVKAQFDDRETGLGAGWHTFHLDDFEGAEAADEGSSSSEQTLAAQSYRLSTDQLSHLEEVEKQAGRVVEEAHKMTSDDTLMGLQILQAETARAVAAAGAGLKQMGLPAPPQQFLSESSPEALVRAATQLNRHLRHVAPVLLEIRDLGRVIAWALVALTMVGIGYLAFHAVFR